MATAEDYAKMSDSEKKKEDWMNSKWRPMMGWMYMVVCTADFVIFPVLWGLLQTIGGGKVETQWMPITLQGWVVPHRHGCHLGYRSLRSHTGKTGRSQQRRLITACASTRRTCAQLWCTCCDSIGSWLLSTQNYTNFLGAQRTDTHIWWYAYSNEFERKAHAYPARST